MIRIAVKALKNSLCRLFYLIYRIIIHKQQCFIDCFIAWQCRLEKKGKKYEKLTCS